MKTTLMVDTIHANVLSIPVSTPFVGGYVTGTPDITWTPADWARFPGVHVRYWQGYGSLPDVHAFDVIDIEAGAVTPAEAASMVRDRVHAGVQWTTLYGTDAVLAETASLIRVMGSAVWNGHVDCVLADWNLNEVSAAALVGSLIHGMSCRGIQWASPSSNPRTLLPGSSLTLIAANCDLNVVDAAWRPSSLPVAPPPAVLSGLVVGPTVHDSRPVSSRDGGRTWS